MIYDIKLIYGILQLIVRYGVWNQREIKKKRILMTKKKEKKKLSGLLIIFELCFQEFLHLPFLSSSRNKQIKAHPVHSTAVLEESSPPYDDYQILLFSPLELVLVADKERVEEMSVL